MSSIIQGIIEGREREDELAVALKQAQQITRGVKYDDTVNGIIAEIQELAGKLGIDPKSVKWAINDVLEAKNNLESAVYGLDELFKDAWQDEKYKNDDEEEGLTEETKAEIRARLDQAIQDFLAKGGQIEKVKPNRVRAKPGMSMASRHIGTPGEFSRQKKSSGPGMGRQLGSGKPVVNVEEEDKKPKTAKALIYQTEVYGAKGYYGQCKEPGCDHKTKTYDRAVQAQNAIKKHHQEHFKVTETHSTGTTVGSAGIGGGVGLGIEKSPMEKVLEKPLGEHINTPGGMGQSYRKFRPKDKEYSEVEENLLNTYGDMFGFPKESSIMKGLQNERKVNEYDIDGSKRKIVYSKENPPDLYYLYQQFIQRMLNPENNIEPNDWIDKVNKHYGLNYTWKDYQKRGHNDQTNNWEKIVNKYILKK
jgi:hypothetical protein